MIRNYFLNLSLNNKLIGMMLFLTFILVLILLFFYGQTEKALLKELENQTADLSKAIQVGVEEVTGSGSTDEMRLYNYLQKLNAKGVKEISVISTTDKIIASTNPTKVGEPVSVKKKQRIIKAELGEPVSKEGKAYNVILPVIADNTQYGYIHLQINIDDFSDVLRMSAIKRVIATLFVFGLGIIIAMFFSWMYTKPIHNVVDAARRVAAGDLTPNLTTDRKDEIGELTQSFNYMIQKLRDERALEERLREAEHLSAVGQLSRSIAHELRNPLNFISLSIDHLRERYAPSENDKEDKFESLMASIKQEIQRLNNLVGDFLDYGKPLKLSLREVDVVNLIEEVIELVWAKAEKDNIEIVKQYGVLPRLYLDPELVKTCIFNVVLNAFQAMPDGGKLIISTETSNSKASIIIEDTGMGLSKENLAKVFNPFFTTKDAGLGLGLAMTKRVIEEHNGKVDFLSREGKGSTMTLSFPIQRG
ncbi:MAG: ATP-binding protein [Nitrospirota bacterium]|nr:ATP-binding protein [Nitrospirota bacterium]MDH5769176.1 ATP-binding protein [Nitrospirota bacterium]